MDSLLAIDELVYQGSRGALPPIVGNTEGKKRKEKEISFAEEQGNESTWAPADLSVLHNSIVSMLGWLFWSD